MHAVLIAALVVLVSVAWLAYTWGVWRTARRISHRMQADREFGISVLEDLAQRWNVKVERQETPGGT